VCDQTLHYNVFFFFFLQLLQNIKYVCYSIINVSDSWAFFSQSPPSRNSSNVFIFATILGFWKLSIVFFYNFDNIIDEAIYYKRPWISMKINNNWYYFGPKFFLNLLNTKALPQNNLPVLSLF
jgi:hypothetical protein